MKLLFSLALITFLFSACAEQQAFDEVSPKQIEYLIKTMDLRVAEATRIYDQFIAEFEATGSYADLEATQKALEHQMDLVRKTASFDEGYVPNDASDFKSWGNSIIKMYQLAIGIELKELSRGLARPDSPGVKKVLKDTQEKVESRRSEYEKLRSKLIKEFGLKI